MTRPFKLTPPPLPLEQTLHETVAKLLKQLIPPGAAVEWACYPAGLIQLTPAQMAKLSASGLQTGWPDFLIVHDGGVYGIELKRRGGTLSEDRIAKSKFGTRLVIGQKTRFPSLIAAGMREIAVCTTAQQVFDNLARWGVPLRGRIAA